jgi:hypothetical protein
MTKVMCLMGHNSYKGCRFCYIKGIFCQHSKHIYYPCAIPKSYKQDDYNPSDLPKRTSSSFNHDIMKIQRERTKNMRNTYMKETGMIMLIN